MWELDHKEGWALKNWGFWTVVLEKTLESPLDSKEIQPVHPKGNQSWIIIRRTDAEAETPILWPPDVNNWLIRKDPDAGKDWKKEKGTTEDEMVRCHHRLDGREFEQAPRVDDGQGSWHAADHGVAKSRTRPSDWTELNRNKDPEGLSYIRELHHSLLCSSSLRIPTLLSRCVSLPSFWLTVLLIREHIHTISLQVCISALLCLE